MTILSYEEFGRRIVNDRWGYETQDVSKTIKSLTDERQQLCLLATIAKQLEKIRSAMDLLLDPVALKKVRKEKLKEAEEQEATSKKWADWKAELDRETTRHAEWLIPVVNRLFDGVLRSEAEKLDKRFVNKVRWGFLKIAKNGLSSTAVSALKGPPESWDVTKANGIGKVLGRKWKEMFLTNDTEPMK